MLLEFLHLETLTYIPDSGNDNSEISYDSSNSIDSGGSSQIEEPSQVAGESEDSGESVQESADSESN